MHNYKVEFIDDGETEVKSIDADNPGHAFYKCQREFPLATMIKCWREGTRMAEAYTEYLPPRVQRDPVPEPKPPGPMKRNDRSCVLPFYDECLSQKKRAT